MPVQLEFEDPERGDGVIIPVAPEALPEDDRGAYPEDTCEADTWKRFDEYPQKMARATAHLDAIPSDWKPPVPLHDKVAAAKKKMGRALPQMVPEEEPDDEDFEAATHSVMHAPGRESALIFSTIPAATTSAP